MRLIDADKIEPHEHLESFCNNHAEYAMVAYMDDINTLPTVDAIPVVHAHWIHHQDWETDGECGYECSRCGMGSDVNHNYCMRCGAKMDGKDGDHNVYNMPSQ